MYKGRETRGSSYREVVGSGEQNGLGIYEGNCLFENKLYVREIYDNKTSFWKDYKGFAFASCEVNSASCLKCHHLALIFELKLRYQVCPSKGSAA